MWDSLTLSQTEFAVDMTCQSCVTAVSTALKDLPGIDRYDIDLAGKRVTITGRTPPSQLFAALKSTERQVIARGSSAASSSFATQAAVSILESPLPLPTSIASTSNLTLATPASEPSSRPLPGMNEEEFSQKVFGICRFVQIAPKTILMDLTVRLPPPANVGLKASHSWDVYISKTGNLVDPPESTGPAFRPLGKIVPDGQGYGDLFTEIEGEVWEWIGRGCVVEAGGSSHDNSRGRIFAGVVARSAGAWGNDKTVCACSGRTMWEEGRDMEKKVGGLLDRAKVAA
ncbi:superoxide dismutase [Kockovaella imperatae]|uniref:Superoxide dismutase 1 copper chaperone n=1 Tax=Kockovaella imperatae TaxID=4999 RepID=A0A1Y1UJZ1_9TREE|nr:superoxide dismutase [Kockovaella imperatae]ORX37786.1 superoxide dismutase [Kockovaella imperatae]